MVNSQDLEYLLYEFRRGKRFFPNFVAPRSKLNGAFLPFINLREANLSQSDFRHAVLPGAEFWGAILEGVSFEHTNLLGADLSCANLQQANLDHALLASANLQNAYLRGASLAGANLADVDLRSADLRNTNLTGAQLKNANLAEANLFGARISPNALREAILKSTVMPDGSYCTQEQQPSLQSWNLSGKSKTSPSLSRFSSCSLKRKKNLKKYQGLDLKTRDQEFFLDEITTLENIQIKEQNPGIPPKTKYVGFKVSEESGELVLEIVENISNQDGSFICINHFL